MIFKKLRNFLSLALIFLKNYVPFYTGRNKKYQILANRIQIRHKSAKCIANRQIRNISYKKSEKLQNSIYPICGRFTTYFRYMGAWPGKLRFETFFIKIKIFIFL